MAGSSTIKAVKARHLLDTKGRPVAEVDIITQGGALGRAGASTGTSVGKNEAHVLRDGDPACFGGLSVYKAIENIETVIGPALVGMDATDQRAIDNRMLELDGTRYKTKLGGNAIFACSVAAARAGAQSAAQPLYRYLAGREIHKVFTPIFNMVNGGSYGGRTLAFQEFIVIPCGVATVAESVRIGVEVFYKLGEVLQKAGRAAMGNYSGYGAPSDDPWEVFDLLEEAVSQLGYRKHCIYAMDCASSEIYDEKENAYRYRGKLISREELIEILGKLAKRYPIAFIEDALQEEDFEGYQLASRQIDTVLIGDDFLCTSVDRARKAVELGAARGMILKPNQAGTVTEAMDTVAFMKEKELLVVASGRAGGVLDDPNGDLAIAVGAPMMKTGAPRSGERVMWLNQAIRIEEEMGGTDTLIDVLSLPGFQGLGRSG